MNRYKVCVYAICKDEVTFVDRWMDSMGEADLVVVTDTGSKDGTVKKLKSRGAVVHKAKVRPWRFDTARNISLAHVPDDVDICVCTDLDEVFSPGWRAHLEKAWSTFKSMYPGETAKTGKYLYNWSLKPDGSPDVQFYYFKAHTRRGFSWKCPVHEYLKYEGTLPLETVMIKGMVLDHYPDPLKSRGSYLSLLELGVREEPENERMRYYLGREYLYQKEWRKCVNTLQDYLLLPAARWNEERCAAMRWIARSFLELKDLRSAYVWYYKALGEAPHMREPYVEFAKMCYLLEDWPMALFLAEEALTIKERSKTYVNMGYAWDHTPNDLGAIAAYHLGLFEKAAGHAKKALSLAPKDERLQNNLAIMEKSEALKAATPHTGR